MASTFASGPESGEDNSSLFPAIIGQVSASIVLTTGFTTARLIAKKTITNYRVEDYLSIAAWVLITTFACTLLAQGTKGFGRHVWDVPESEDPTLSKMSWAIEILYCATTWTAKVALLFQLQHFFSPRKVKKGAVWIACQSMIWLNAAFYLSSIISLLVECVPTNKIWNPTVQGGYCINDGALLIAMGVVNIVSDIMIFALPIWAIWHLQMALRTKLGVSAIFAVGLLALACSICRLVYTFPPLHSNDASYLFAPLAMWSLAEMTSIIICTSIPLMPRFIRVIRRKHKKQQHVWMLPTWYKNGKSGSKARSKNRKGRDQCKDCINSLPCVFHTRDKESTARGSFDSKDADEKTLDGASTDDSSYNDPSRSQSESSEPKTDSTTDVDMVEPPPRSSYTNHHPMNSSGFITVHREYQVRRNVHSDQLESGLRLSFPEVMSQHSQYSMP